MQPIVRGAKGSIATVDAIGATFNGPRCLWGELVKFEDRRASDLALSGGTSFGTKGPRIGALFRSPVAPMLLNGGHLTATANANFTEATIEPSRSASTNAAPLRKRPAAPGRQRQPSIRVPKAAAIPVSDGPQSFALEGCRGQSLVFRIEYHETYEETDEPPVLRITGGGGEWTMFTFGYHPVEEEEQRIVNASPPADPGYPPVQHNFIPRTFALSPDCRTVQPDSTRYVFAFGRMGCHKARNLAQARFRSGHAPRGYVCQSHSSEGVRCWRRHRPAKFFEWRRPRSRS
jgi:hypothetical protein